MNTEARITLYGEGEPNAGLIGAFVGGTSRVKIVEARVDSDGGIAETADAAAKAARTAAYGQETRRHKPVIVSAPGDVIDQIKIVDESEFTSGILFIPEEMDFGNDKGAAQTIAESMTEAVASQTETTEAPYPDHVGAILFFKDGSHVTYGHVTHAAVENFIETRNGGE